jgi:hypothetical protein
MPKILAFVPDIFFQARISETAKRVDSTVVFTPSVESFLSAAQSPGDPPSLFVVDLNAREPGNPDAGLAALERVRAAGNQTPAVAFLSHVQHELAGRAATLQGVEIMPRSKFTQDLAAILSRVKS